jgi:hypothetical protein
VPDWNEREIILKVRLQRAVIGCKGIHGWVVMQFDKRTFPRGLKPCQFTALIGAETQD